MLDIICRLNTWIIEYNFNTYFFLIILCVINIGLF